MFIIRLDYPIITITITPSRADVLPVNNAIKNANIIIFVVEVKILRSVIYEGKKFFSYKSVKSMA